MYDPMVGLFKMIYSGIGHTHQRDWRVGYDESNDGVNWVKPRIGRFEWLGSKDNNIVLAGQTVKGQYRYAR